jgi:hypothetical protein
MPSTLERTGAIDGLLMPNEAAGPDSREAYRITIGRYCDLLGADRQKYAGLLLALPG